MSLLLQAAALALGALVIDWVIHVQMQTIWAATHEGRQPGRYSLGPCVKLALVFAYLVPLNFGAARASGKLDALFIVTCGLFLIYVCYASWAAVRKMTPHVDDLQRVAEEA